MVASIYITYAFIQPAIYEMIAANMSGEILDKIEEAVNSGIDEITNGPEDMQENLVRSGHKQTGYGWILLICAILGYFYYKRASKSTAQATQKQQPEEKTTQEEEQEYENIPYTNALE